MCFPITAADVAECLNDGEGIFCSYLVLYKCDLGNHPGALFLLVPWLIMLLLALGSTADAFLMPQLDYISNLLRLSPDVAGVTFLALGNGAPAPAGNASGAYTRMCLYHVSSELTLQLLL